MDFFIGHDFKRVRRHVVSLDLGFNAYARLYNAAGKVIAEERLVNCLP